LVAAGAIITLSGVLFLLSRRIFARRLRDIREKRAQATLVRQRPDDGAQLTSE
jgi:hypothetical protein